MEPKYDELYHYGILGMKWGIRRYQNPDGSLTEAGRKHYGSNRIIGDKKRLRRSIDAAEVSSKMYKLSKKKVQTDKRKAKIQHLEKVYQGLIKDLDSREIEYGEKEYKILLRSRSSHGGTLGLSLALSSLGFPAGGAIGGAVLGGIEGLVIGLSKDSRQANKLRKELKKENKKSKSELKESKRNN